MAPGLPATIVIRHPKERVRKCSAYPLRHRPDFLFLPYPPSAPLDLTDYVRLAPEGPPLSLADAGCGLLVLDGSWRWAEVMTRRFEDVPPRSLRGYQTVYPRVSKRYPDPAGGLASVEAIYLAYYILGRPLDGLLDHYHWRDEFLRANAL
jgi:pre-rRNA-processing protein TSR3